MRNSSERRENFFGGFDRCQRLFMFSVERQCLCAILPCMRADLRDDDGGVPGEDLLARDPRELTATEAGGDVDHAGLVDVSHRL